MRPLVILKHDPATDTPTRLGHRTMRLDEYLRVFQAPPKPFDEDVVREPALTIHADPNPWVSRASRNPALVNRTP